MADGIGMATKLISCGVNDISCQYAKSTQRPIHKDKDKVNNNNPLNQNNPYLVRRSISPSFPTFPLSLQTFAFALRLIKQIIIKNSPYILTRREVCIFFLYFIVIFPL